MGMQFDYPEDEIILKENEENRHMYMILEGSVAMYSGYGTPDEYLYGILGKGKSFGELGLLTHEASIYTVVAVSDVKVAMFSENELGSFIRSYPDCALGIMRSVARLNQIFRYNLKLVVEESKDYARYRKLYEDAYRQLHKDDEITLQEELDKLQDEGMSQEGTTPLGEGNDDSEKWRHLRLRKK